MWAGTPAPSRSQILSNGFPQGGHRKYLCGVIFKGAKHDYVLQALCFSPEPGTFFNNLLIWLSIFLQDSIQGPCTGRSSKPSLLSSPLGHFSLGHSDSLSLFMVPLISALKPPEPQHPFLLRSSLHPFPSGFQRRIWVPRNKHSGEAKAFPAREQVRSRLGPARSLPLNIPMGLNADTAAHLCPSSPQKENMRNSN